MGHNSLAVWLLATMSTSPKRTLQWEFWKFVEYRTRNVAEGIEAAFQQASDAVQ
jgi:hypothetical protein